MRALADSSLPEGIRFVNQVFWYERVGALRNRPCVFLDRDGVVVEEVNYLHRREDVHLVPGIKELILTARELNYAVGLVTNQSGIARGYYDWIAFENIQREIADLLCCGADPFDFIAACGTHPEATIEALRVPAHSWRKPMPGMLLAAAACLELNLAESFMIGDQFSDVRAADMAAVGHICHVATGHGGKDRAAVANYRLESSGALHLINGLDEVLPGLSPRNRINDSLL